MDYVTFGNTGMRASRFALGTGQLGSTEGSIDEELARAIVERYLNAGGNLIDTAEAYQGGQSEHLLGKLLRDRRDDVVLASKFGRSTTQHPSPGRAGAHRKAMVQSVEGSLKRLQTDRIDVYFVHFDDGVTPIDEIVQGLDDLIAAGKILYGGLSNFPAWRTALASASMREGGRRALAAVEIEYNLLHRTSEREILPLSRSQGLAVLAYSPLAAGALAGGLARAKAGSRIGIDSEADVEATLASVRRIAALVEAEPAHVALAWLVAKGCFPVLGARSVEQLTQSLAGASLALTADHVRQLDAASAFRLGYPQELLALMQGTD